MPDAEGHGPPEGLPDLPPEWGPVVIPDDASALAEEAALLRRELRRQRSRRRLGLVSRPGGQPPLGLPLLILLVAVLTTAAGLLAGTWPRAADHPTVVPYPSPTLPAVPTGRPLPALDLVDADQSPVPLRGLLPAVIILVDACACADQVAAAAAAVPAGVTVVTVAGGRTVRGTPPRAVRALADPAGGLRAFIHLPARPGAAPALLVDRSGTLIRVVPEVETVEDHPADLARLTS